VIIAHSLEAMKANCAAEEQKVMKQLREVHQCFLMDYSY
jgi:hypothetical protein